MLRELTALQGVVEFATPSAVRFGPTETTPVREGMPATVEIVAPDRFCARVFLELMGSAFPFELVGTGASWVISLQPPQGSSWEGRLLSLVQRWLETCPLPCATIGYRGRRYVFRSNSTDAGSWSGFDGPHDLDPSCADAACRGVGFRQSRSPW